MIRPLPFVAGLTMGALALHERRARARAERFAAAGLESLLRAIDANDAQTGAHVRRVAEYALVLARALGLDSDDRRTVELAALFHDVGKIHEAIDDIVQLPRKLTPNERRAIAKHPQRGAEVLAPIAHFHPQLAEAVLSHHERWDGSGYPRGLRGEQIPLTARIVALADTFDAVTHRRYYRAARAAVDAARVIEQGRGTQFDPALVDLMLLPPVFDEIAIAHRRSAAAARRKRRKRKERREERTIEPAPNVRIRWHTDTPMPPQVGMPARAKSASRPRAVATARS